MNKFLIGLPKRIMAIVASVALLASFAPGALALSGPTRETRVWSSTVAGFDHVQFNSFTEVPNGIGDEQDFLRGIQVGRDSVWSDPVANVTQDATVEGKIYIHNNADATLNTVPDANGGFVGIAKNETVRVAIPTASAKTQDVTAFIKADNATPVEVSDTMTVNGANNGFLELAFVPGSAKLHSGSTETPVSDTIVTTGANIGDQLGCFDFVQEVTFQMKVSMPNYSIAKTVRLDGQGPNDWKESIAVNPGQIVEWKIDFENIGKTSLKNVKIVDQVPANVTVVAGSVKLFNSNFPNGYTFNADAVQANGKQINVDIGTHLPGGGSIVLFKTKVDDESKLANGTTTIVNNAYATPEGYGAIRDDATVTVTKNSPVTTASTTPTPTPAKLVNTGAGSVVGVFAGTSVLAAGAYQWIIRRRLNVQ